MDKSSKHRPITVHLLAYLAWGDGVRSTDGIWVRMPSNGQRPTTLVLSDYPVKIKPIRSVCTQ